MISTEKIIGTDWQTIYDEVVRRFENIPLCGDYGFVFSEDVSTWDFYLEIVYVDEDQLRAKSIVWHKLNDYKNRGEKSFFIPAISYSETILTAEEKAYFKKFYDQLLVIPEGQLIERSPGIGVLDGSHNVFKLFSQGKIEREFRWGPYFRT